MNVSLAIITSTVALASLLVLVHQSRSLSDSVRAQAYQSIVNTQLQYDALFLDKPHLFAFAYGDESLPDVGAGEIAVQARIAVDMLLNVVDLTFQQRDLIPENARGAWADYGRFVMARPAVQQYTAEVRSWFPLVQAAAAQAPSHDHGSGEP